MITLGPNAREDEVVVLSWGTAHQKKFLDDLPGEQVFSMSLQRYKQGNSSGTHLRSKCLVSLDNLT